MINLQLPSDGSVIIVDDKIEEALPLIKLLSKKGIASVYYSGKDEELPEVPVQKVRLAFVDIQLFPAADSHTYAQNVIRLLERIVPKDNGPYILIIWSLLEDVHGSTLINEVTSETFSKRPMAVLPLRKSTFFETRHDDSLKEDLLGEIDSTLGVRFPEDDIVAIKTVIENRIISHAVLVAKKEALVNISSLLLKELAKNDGIRLFTIWETLVHRAAGEIVNSFSSLHETDEYWQDNLKHTIYRMAQAQLGKTVTTVKEDELIRNALKTVNHALLDVIENKISEITGLAEAIRIDGGDLSYSKQIGCRKYRIRWASGTEKYQLFAEDAGKPWGNHKREVNGVAKLAGWGSQADKAAIEVLIKEYLSVPLEINTRLLVNAFAPKSITPGNVYEIKIQWKRKRKLLETYWTRDQLDKLRALSNTDIKEFVFIELEVSPLCDYSQAKWLKSRLLPGVLIPEKFISHLKKSESFYKEIPSLRIDGSRYIPVFEFRLLKSVDLEKDNSRQPMFKLKNEVLADIITRLSGHVSRVGVTCVE
jgi:hypothetical protein